MKQILAWGCDIALIAFGAIAALRFTTEWPIPQPMVLMLFVALIAGFATTVFRTVGVYRSWRARPIISLAVRLIAAWSSVQLAGWIFLSVSDRPVAITGTWVLLWTALTGFALVAVRVLVYSALRRLRFIGLDVRAVAVVGSGVHFREIIEKLNCSKTSGLYVARSVELHVPDENESGPIREESASALEGLVRLVESGEVQEIWLAVPLESLSRMNLTFEIFKDSVATIRLLPDVRAFGLTDTREALDVLGFPSISMTNVTTSADALTDKEIFDRLFAAGVLVMLAPLFFCIAIAIKLSSPGPIFFKQMRKGLNGRPFSIYKFRSMHVHRQAAGVLKQAMRNDPRVTSVGRFLRRTSLDELPQFINVLRGEMSVVGPRPHALEHDAFYRQLIDGYISRYRVKPGITGWAQINGFRGETDQLEKMVGRVEHDLYYMQNWSFGLDLQIVMSTIVKGFIGAQAY
ncbi:undecaprenyl-phosphate glucose phosphotransferase [Paraburkholderia aromaticivorans]|uniref:undecaprenyl-phosphate glucose phosphotransferase n=1 Tax=Paraburkholderia aromaticivorans TaxID=2026199 RepID=UPI0014562367|nr:undecaprenyl-phosphate glucose phosphotransferase [Paraburkholderia aromaticivorans]